jgi:hypothetical protein
VEAIKGEGLMGSMSVRSATVRDWMLIWLQGRRRKRAASHAGPPVPNAPANLVGEDLVTFIQLTWQDMSSDESGFHLYRKVDAGSYQLYQILGANVTSYQDSAVITGHSYRYRVAAFNAQGDSAQSNEVFLVFGA